LRVEGREKGGHGTRRETACTAEVGKVGRARFEGAGTGKRADTELGRRGLGGHVCGWTGGTKGGHRAWKEWVWRARVRVERRARGGTQGFGQWP
jgi:hypothetical protein